MSSHSRIAAIATVSLSLAATAPALALVGRGVDVAADPKGNGYVLVEAPAGAGFGYLLRRYDPVGRLDWSRSLPANASGRALAVAPDGTVVVAARFARGPDIFDMWLAKYSPGGRKVWSRIADRDYLDRVRDVAVAPDGSVYLAGEPWVGKFSPAGRLLWKRTWFAGIRTAAAGRDGSLYLAGSALRKYSPEGKVIWTRPLPPGLGEIAGAAASADGGFCTVGTAGVASPARDAQVARFRPDGTLAWVRSHDGSAGGSDAGHGIAAARDGTIYVTGSVTEQASGTADIWMAAWRPSGRLLWTAALDGPHNGADEGLAVATVPGGAVFTGATGLARGRPSLWIGRIQSFAKPARR